MFPEGLLNSFRLLLLVERMVFPFSIPGTSRPSSVKLFGFFFFFVVAA